MTTTQIPPNRIGADYGAADEVDVVKLAAAGATFVSRYLSVSADRWKVITAEERDAIWSAGLGLLLNWEAGTTSWDRPADGTAHGRQAAEMAAALGYPTNLPIIASIDTDVEGAQIEVAAEYLGNFRGAIGEYPLGIYGAAPIANMVGELASFVWATESTAWGSHYDRSPNLQQHTISNHPAFEQFRNAKGPTIDLNMTLTQIDVWTAGGGSSTPSTPVPPSPPSPPSPPEAQTYTVQRGDTLSRVATNHHTTVAELLRVNPAITNPNLITVGQVINLP